MFEQKHAVVQRKDVGIMTGEDIEAFPQGITFMRYFVHAVTWVVSDERSEVIPILHYR